MRERTTTPDVDERLHASPPQDGRRGDRNFFIDIGQVRRSSWQNALLSPALRYLACCHDRSLRPSAKLYVLEQSALPNWPGRQNKLKTQKIHHLSHEWPMSPRSYRYKSPQLDCTAGIRETGDSGLHLPRSVGNNGALRRNASREGRSTIWFALNDEVPPGNQHPQDKPGTVDANCPLVKRTRLPVRRTHLQQGYSQRFAHIWSLTGDRSGQCVSEIDASGPKHTSLTVGAAWNLFWMGVGDLSVACHQTSVDRNGRTRDIG